MAPGGGGLGGAVIGVRLVSRKSSPPIANEGGGSMGLLKDGILTLKGDGTRSISGFNLMGELTMIGGDNGCCCCDDVRADRGGGGEIFSSTGNDNRSSEPPSCSVTGTEQKRTQRYVQKNLP